MSKISVVCAAAILAAAGLMGGSQSIAASSSATNSWVLGAGRHGQAIAITYVRPDFTMGMTGQMLLVGVPGSTDDVNSADLPATAVLRQGNEVPSTPSATTSMLGARFTPPRSGEYPVFLMTSVEPMCGSAKMMESASAAFAMSQVGVVRIS
ncbi:MAG TPA: hypothetical protein VEL02_06980 [Jatrophihabitantaceae bacterium]|nr:hypothetical protein [Jatrophihabitantaceae bacterium]